MKKLIALITIALTLFFWTDGFTHLPCWWWQSDGWSDVMPGPPFPRPTPIPYRTIIVQPHIESVYPPGGRPAGSPTPRPLPI